MKLVLFDWNGTLLDDTLLWYDVVLKVFHTFGKQAPTLEQYFRELEGDYFIIYTSRGIDVTRERLNEIYAKHYQALMYQAPLMPGAQEVLQALHDSTHALYLVTGQLESLVSPLLEKFGIVSYFKSRKFHVTDKAGVINEVLEMEKVEPKNCFYVGDTPSDMRHAKKAGIVSIAFLGGHIPNECIANSQPDFSIQQLRDILTIV